MRWLIFMLGLAAAGGAAVLWLGGEDAPPGWRTATVTRADVRETVSATGALDAVVAVDVGTQVSGIVSELLVDFNDPVTAGQVVARIDTALLEADVRGARASLGLARAEADEAASARRQVDRLAEKGAATEAEVIAAATADDVARARVEAARVGLGRAERNLLYATITSPIDGVVVQRDVDVGQTVNAGMSAPRLFRVAGDLSRMRILAAVDEADIGRVRVGQEVRFTVQAWPSETFAGTVEQVRLQSTVQENIVTYTVVVGVENDGRLLPGMTATVDIVVAASPQTLCVGTAALRFQPDPARVADPPEGRGVYVWVPADAGKLRPVAVERGLSDGVCTEVKGEAIEEGLVVVTGVQREAVQASSSPFGGGQGGGRPSRGF